MWKRAEKEIEGGEVRGPGVDVCTGGFPNRVYIRVIASQNSQWNTVYPGPIRRSSAKPPKGANHLFPRCCPWEPSSPLWPRGRQVPAAAQPVGDAAGAPGGMCTGVGDCSPRVYRKIWWNTAVYTTVPEVCQMVFTGYVRYTGYLLGAVSTGGCIYGKTM